MKKLFSVRTIILASSLLLQLSTLCFHSRGAAGDVDLSFDPGSGVNGVVNAVALQPDGKMIIGGSFTTVKGLARTDVARLNADGSGDSSFTAGAYGVPYGDVYALALQPDGKVLVGHGYGIARLNSDGSLDTNFNASIDSLIDEGYATVNSIAVQLDGKVLIAGVFYTLNGTNGNSGITRLNANGSLDTSFNVGAGINGTGYSLALQSDGKVLVGGQWTTTGGTNNGIVRLNINGSLDNSFNPGTGYSHVFSVVVQPDGKVLIGGDFTTVNGTNRNRIARLNANGSLDSSFNPGTGVGGVGGYSYGVRAVVVQSDGKVLFGGGFNTVNGTNVGFGIARLHADGSLDSSFHPGTGANGGVVSVALQPGGKVLIGGGFTTVNGTNRNRMARLNDDGSLDGSFLPGRGVSSSYSSLVVQPDGKVLIGGAYTFINGTNRYGAGARLNADGSLDSTFIPTNFPADIVVANTDYSGTESLVVQSDGKVLIGGYTVTTIEIDEFGNHYYSFGCFVTRVNANGSRDTSFELAVGGSGNGWYARDPWSPTVRALAVQRDGKILVGGLFGLINGTNRNGIARLNANGSLDNGFNAGTGNALSVYSVASQSDGKVLIGGSYIHVNGTNLNRIARLNADGSLDSSFNPGTGANDTVRSVALQPDGKVLIAGSFTTVNGTNRNRIARLNANGSLDSSFNPGTGADGNVLSIALQSDGNILIGGGFTTVNGVLRPYLARLYGDSPAPSLNIARSNAFVIVSWPVTGLNFQLQEATNLSLPNAWSPVAQPAVTNAGQISVTVPTTAGRKFFRLKSQ